MADKPKPKKVVTGKVSRRKKKSPMAESLSASLQSVLETIIIPNLKTMLHQSINVGSYNMIFTEEDQRHNQGFFRAGPSNVPVSSRTNYNKVQPNRDANRPELPSPLSKRDRAMHNFEQIKFEFFVDADNALSALYHELETYEVVSVSDFYMIVGETPQFTDENWGWTSLTGARVEPIRFGGGFTIVLPQPQPLD